MSNLFASTNIDQIQALGLLGHFLRNNLDMNCAWMTMGRPSPPSHYAFLEC